MEKYLKSKLVMTREYLDEFMEALAYSRGLNIEDLLLTWELIADVEEDVNVKIYDRNHVGKLYKSDGEIILVRKLLYEVRQPIEVIENIKTFNSMFEFNEPKEITNGENDPKEITNGENDQ